MKPELKIYFLVGQYYIHAEPYHKLASELRSLGLNCSLYYIGEMPNDHSLNTSVKQKLQNIQVKNLPIYFLNTKKGFINRPLQFVRLFLNKFILKMFICDKKPDLVIVSGDITNMNTRLFLDLCKELNIKVLLIPITIPGKSVVNSNSNKNIPMARFVRLVLRYFNLEKVVFFRDWVLGNYHEESVIALPDENTRRLLCKNGVSDKRLAIVGNIEWDKINDILLMPIEKIKAKVFRTIDIPQNSKLVVFCTELVQDIYGIEYCERILQLLYDAFEGLPENIKVVIKLHPREPINFVRLYRKIFKGKRFCIIQDIDNYFLLRASKLVISFYSALLSDAALLETSVLSIRTIDDETPIRFGQISEFVHITSDEEIKVKVLRALTDDYFRSAAFDFVNLWKKQSNIEIDGKSVKRTVDLILDQIGIEAINDI